MFITQMLSFLDRGSKQGLPWLPPLTWPCRTVPPEDQLGRTPGSEPPRPRPWSALCLAFPSEPGWGWKGSPRKPQGLGGGALARLLGKEQPRLCGQTLLPGFPLASQSRTAQGGTVSSARESVILPLDWDFRRVGRWGLSETMKHRWASLSRPHQMGRF